MLDYRVTLTTVTVPHKMVGLERMLIYIVMEAHISIEVLEYSRATV